MTADGPRRAVRRGAETEGMAVGMVKRFNQGDRVFIPAVIHAEYEGRTQPIYEVLALGDVPADRVLPSSDALPKVARWMAENPQGATELKAALDAIEEYEMVTMPAPCMARLRSLIAALTTDGGA